MLPSSLIQILKENSRSFYLSLVILPSALRFPISLAYLLARIADTIADTKVILQEKRKETLEKFSQAVWNGGIAEQNSIFTEVSLRSLSGKESALLQNATATLALLSLLDTKARYEVQQIVDTLIKGMLQNLADFPGEDFEGVASLKNQAHLKQYVYEAAGCVGEFWTRIAFLKTPKLRSLSFSQMTTWGIAYGEGLQLINILQDLPGDLAEGRCYLPEEQLKQFSVLSKDLRQQEKQKQVKPLIDEMILLAEENLYQGFRYVEQLPVGELRLRLASSWPLLIGIQTLEKLKQHEDLFSPTAKIKIKRKDVYLLLLKTLFLFPFGKGSRLCFSRCFRKKQSRKSASIPSSF